eukprot:3297429-Prymnesium_polylepis.1
MVDNVAPAHRHAQLRLVDAQRAVPQHKLEVATERNTARGVRRATFARDAAHTRVAQDAIGVGPLPRRDRAAARVDARCRRRRV